MKPLTVFELGLTPYDEALSFQYELVEKVIESKGRNSFLVLLEHAPVITLGKNANEANVLATNELLAENHIELKKSSRGGDVTYHGPGQLVGYPILNLSHHKKTMREYVRAVEETIIKTLSEYGITGYVRDDKSAGVWVKSADGDPAHDAKIGFIGMRVTKGITYHGFSLNVNNDLDAFDMINPCGMKSPNITSMMQMAGKEVYVSDVIKTYIKSFKELFGTEGVEVKTHLSYIPKEIV